MEGVQPPSGFDQALGPLPEPWLDGIYRALPRGGSQSAAWGARTTTAETCVANALPLLLGDSDPNEDKVTVAVVASEGLCKTLARRFPALDVVELDTPEECDGFDGHVAAVVSTNGAAADAALGLAFRARGARFCVAGVGRGGEKHAPVAENPVCARRPRGDSTSPASAAARSPVSGRRGGAIPLFRPSRRRDSADDLAAISPGYRA